MTVVAEPTVDTNPAIGDPATEQEPPKVAHIVQARDGLSASALILEATLGGTPLTAICGHVWVPTRDPKPLPVCEECARIVANKGGSVPWL